MKVLNKTMEKTVYSCERKKTKKQKRHTVNNDRGSGFPRLSFLVATLALGSGKLIQKTFSCAYQGAGFWRLNVLDTMETREVGMGEAGSPLRLSAQPQALQPTWGPLSFLGPVARLTLLCQSQTVPPLAPCMLLP